MTHLAVITNRGSTRNLRGDNWIDSLLGSAGGVAHFKIDHADQAADAVRRCAAMDADTIIVNGGDGTAGLVFAALLNGGIYSTLPTLALLPSGRTNMTTAGWSLTGAPETAMASVLKCWRDGTLAGHVVSRPVLTLQQKASSPPLYGAFFGAAEIVEGIRFCRRSIYPLNLPNTVSHAAALATLLWRGLRTTGQYGSVAVLENERALESGDFFVVAVTALDELLLGIQPKPGEMRPENGHATLHYLSLRIGAGHILGMLPGLLRRQILPGAGRTVRRLERLTLCFTGTYTLDGELYEARSDEPLVLDGSRRLNFIRIPL